MNQSPLFRPKKVSSVQVLRNREIFGYPCQKRARHLGASHSRFFSSFPSRLLFSLKELVSLENLITEPHVFLGFSGDGAYILSYTEAFEEHNGFPTYVYRLYWWLFRFNKKLKKTATIKLFANEEISSSLLLTYAEWPQTKSKIIVYGWGNDTDSCYITVAAVPPLSSCHLCNNLANDMQPVNNQRCFNHGFSVHMKHTSVSTQTIILNLNGLKIDNLIVVNMGHSIGVISLGILDFLTNKEQLPLSTIKQATFGEKPSIREKEESFQENWESPHDFVKLPKVDKDEKIVHTELANELPSTFISPRESPRDVYSFTQNESSPDIRVTIKQNLNQKESSSGAQETASILCSCSSQMPPPSTPEYRANSNLSGPTKHSRPGGVDPYLDYYSEPKSIVLRQTSYSGACSALSGQAGSVKYQNENFCSRNLSSKRQYNQHSSSVARAKRIFNRTRRTSQGSDNDLDKMPLSPVQDCSLPLRLETSEDSCTYCGLRIESKPMLLNTNGGKTVEGLSKKLSLHRASPSISKLRKQIINIKSKEQEVDLNASTPSPSASESSGSVYCFGDASTTNTLKFENSGARHGDGVVSFTETFYEEPSLINEREDGDGSAQASDENSLFYGPVTFQSSSGTPMVPCRSQCDALSTAKAFSQHLVLDIEHVIFDVLRTRCYITYKFGLLIDYDVQIIDTCASTRSVVVFIVALLDVSPKRKRGASSLLQHANNAASKREIQFFLCWRLQTGRYEVVAASPLRSHNHHNEKADWDAKWTSEACANVRRLTSLPHPHPVYSLNNTAVLRGKSLNFLWDADRYIAIRK